MAVDDANVWALADRAIVLHFDPPNAEVHRAVAGWFRDAEMYDLIARVLPVAGPVSMRHYCEGSQLRRPLRPGEFLVVSTRIANSFDSRCYGPVRAGGGNAVSHARAIARR